MAQWIQEAVEGMKKRKTLGTFGKATSKHIASAKKEGGIEKKRAIFAENMKHISEHRREHYKSGQAI